MASCPTTAALPHVRLIGAPSDCHSSFLGGAASAPSAIRAALTSDHGNAAAESGLELGIDLVLDDAGDLPLADTRAATKGDDRLLHDAVALAVREGAMPLILGGDHAISVPVAAALSDAHGPITSSISMPTPTSTTTMTATPAATPRPSPASWKRATPAVSSRSASAR